MMHYRILKIVLRTVLYDNSQSFSSKVGAYYHDTSVALLTTGDHGKAPNKKVYYECASHYFFTLCLFAPAGAIHLVELVFWVI